VSVIFARHGYSGPAKAGQPTGQPPRLVINRGGQFKVTATVNIYNYGGRCRITATINSINCGGFL